MLEIIPICLPIVLIVTVSFFIGKIRNASEKKRYSSFIEIDNSFYEANKKYNGILISQASSIHQTNRIKIIVRDNEIILVKKLLAGKRVKKSITTKHIINISFDRNGIKLYITIEHSLGDLAAPCIIEVNSIADSEIREKLNKIKDNSID